MGGQLQKEIATHSSILAWGSQGQRSLEGYMQSMGHKKVRNDLATERACSGGQQALSGGPPWVSHTMGHR